MGNIKPNFISISKTIHALENDLARAKQQAGKYFYFRTIQSISNHRLAIPFEEKTDAQLLAEAIADRDWPMSFEDIKEVFDFSCFEYSEADIRLALPNSKECIEQFAELLNGYANF